MKVNRNYDVNNRKYLNLSPEMELQMKRKDIEIMAPVGSLRIIDGSHSGRCRIGLFWGGTPEYAVAFGK